MYYMLKAEVDRLAGKLNLFNEIASKWAKIMDNFLDILTLEGAKPLI